MKIKDMFYKEIDRDIKGVIKVGQADDENVYQELDEYVVTSELESYMMKFFQACIHAAFLQRAREHPEKVALVDTGKEYSVTYDIKFNRRILEFDCLLI